MVDQKRRSPGAASRGISSITARWLPAAVIALGSLAAGCGGAVAAPKSAGERPAAAKADPHAAAVAYAQCMRRLGVPHPDPDAAGDFRLTPADERRLQRVPRAKRRAADAACFRYLRGTVSTKPLSRRAKARALEVLGDLADCMRGYGYELGPPVVQDLPRGRAFFGFSRPPAVPAGKLRDSHRVEHLCERRVDLAGRIDEIVADDRGTPSLGEL